METENQIIALIIHVFLTIIHNCTISFDKTSFTFCRFKSFYIRVRFKVTPLKIQFLREILHEYKHLQTQNYIDFSRFEVSVI